MAIARDTTAEHIKPLGGAIVRRYTSGEAIAAGEIVAMESDGYLDAADCTSAADEATGIAVQAASGAGETIDVVTHGPIVCLTGATPGATVFVSTTAGEPTETDSGNTTAVGWAESATVLYVNPEHLA